MTRTHLLILFFLFPLALKAQTSFKHLTTESGLSNNTVISIVQDSKGFMWFGTDDGLNKYDGQTFRILKPDFKNKKSISHNIAKVLFEDHAGNIWIGTDGGGLNKFDPISEEFTSYYAEEGNLTGLNHNNITAIAEQDNRYLWIGTYGGGLNRLDLSNNTFEHFLNEEGNVNTVASFFINCLAVDDNDNLWIGTWGRGLDQLDTHAMTFTHYMHRQDDVNSLSDNTVNTIFIDQEKNIWAGTWEGGLNLFDRHSKTFSHFNRKENTLPVNNVRSICQDVNDELWVASFGEGLARFNIKTKAFAHFTHQADQATSIGSDNLWTNYFSADNILWTGSIEGGISKLDFNKKKFTNLKNFNDHASQADVIDAIKETSNGEIWMGTFGKGLIQLDSNLQMKKNNALNIPLLSDKVTGILEDSKEVFWISTDAGVTTYDAKTKKSKNYVIAGTKPGLSFSNTKAVYEDHDGTVWIGTWAGGLNRYDRSTDSFQFYFPSPKRKVTFMVDMGEMIISPKGVFISGNFNHWNTNATPMKKVGDHLFEVTLELTPQKIEFRFLNGDVWEKVPSTCAFQKNRVVEIGDADVNVGQIKFSLSCSKIPPVKKESSSGGLADGHIWCITQDHDGMLWIGTNDGLSRFDKRQNVFTSYKRIHYDSTSISDNHVSCIYEDSEHHIWAGTLGGGINLFDRATNTFVSFTEKDGLANNLVKSILEDDDHNLWIATNNGLSKFNYKTRTFKNYNQRNGLDNNSYRIGAALKRKNGEMLFGGVHGITRFMPHSVSSNLMWPKVYITDLLLFGKSLHPGEKLNNKIILDSALIYKNAISLSYDENMLAFTFASTAFSDSGTPVFTYKLEGFDQRWFESTSSNHSASYTNLPPGNYVFKVKAANDEGEFGKEAATLHISISPPFWQTVYFKLLLGILCSLSLYIAYRIISARKEEKLREATLMALQKIKELENEKLQQEVEYKNKELANISMNLVEKTKFLNEQIKRLEGIANISENEVKSKLNHLIDNFNKEITTEKDWEYFELHFDKVHQNFISNLKINFPELTATDIRLAAFIRMNLSNKEIAELMNKSVRSIESSRYRLRKNLNLTQGDNLTDYLFRL
jgi:ligand-binding sensor domain-containing protein